MKQGLVTIAFLLYFAQLTCQTCDYIHSGIWPSFAILTPDTLALFPALANPTRFPSVVHAFNWICLEFSAAGIFFTVTAVWNFFGEYE